MRCKVLAVTEQAMGRKGKPTFRATISLKPEDNVGDSADFLVSLLDEKWRLYRHGLVLKARLAGNNDDDREDVEAESSGDDSDDEDHNPIEDQSDSGDSGEALESFRIGEVVEGEVDIVKQYGVILRLRNGVVGFALEENARAFMKKHQKQSKKKIAAKKRKTKDLQPELVRARVLNVDFTSKIVDLSLSESLVRVAQSKAEKKKMKSARKKKAQASEADLAALPAGTTVSGTVQLKKKDQYAVVSLPQHDNRLAVAALSDYNGAYKAYQNVRIGDRLKLSVLQDPSLLSPLANTLQGVHFLLPTSFNHRKNVKDLRHRNANPLEYKSDGALRDVADLMVRPMMPNACSRASVCHSRETAHWHAVVFAVRRQRDSASEGSAPNFFALCSRPCDRCVPHRICD